MECNRSTMIFSQEKHSNRFALLSSREQHSRSFQICGPKERNYHFHFHQINVIFCLQKNYHENKERVPKLNEVGNWWIVFNDDIPVMEKSRMAMGHGWHKFMMRHTTCLPAPYINLHNETKTVNPMIQCSLSIHYQPVNNSRVWIVIRQKKEELRCWLAVHQLSELWA